ncbi:hypothetical protein GF391_01495 [Candidatus Uhrbacteria bacterium]|nr:hypothetical protein [Candidatus Uhrbacteria bacterium]
MNYNFWKKAGIATGALGTIAIGGAVLASDAAPTMEAQEQFINKRGMMQKMHVKNKLHKAHGFMQNEDVQNAIASRDYNAFAEALTKEDGTMPKILETITADNFDRFADMHEAVMNKDFETAKAIAQELGLPEKFKANHPHFHTPQEREAIREAALNGDYETWFNLVAVEGELPEFLQVINADNFARYQEMHQLMDDAKNIREELGLEVGGPGKGIRGMHKGNGNGRGMGMGLGNR